MSKRIMTKAEHKATNPSAWDMMLWNIDNTDKYTKEEHKAANPDAWDMRQWNLWNDEKYTKEEHKSANPNSWNMRLWNELNDNKYTKEEIEYFASSKEDKWIKEFENKFVGEAADCIPEANWEKMKAEVIQFITFLVSKK